MNRLIGIALMVLVVVGCRDTIVSPSEVRDERRSTVLHSVNSGSNSPSSPDVGSVLTQCETINIKARRVLSVSPGEVKLRVTASYTPQAKVRVRFVDSDTGRVLGDFSLGNIALSLSPGTYTLRIFVEVPSYPGGLIQCDGSVTFTIPEFPIPPLPECVGDGCNPDPSEESN